MDYQFWTRHVRRFSEGLRELPGEVSAMLEIDPPLAAEEISGIAAKWKTGLPDSLSRLWTEGSARINCRYVWTPPPEEAPLLHEVFEYQRYIYGGVRFEPASEIFPGNAGLEPDDGLVRETLGDADFALWLRSAIFLHVGNGDCLGLDPERNPADPAVVYLVHDDEESEYVSPSFSEFLTAWSELSFIGPEFWLLDYWLDRESGKLIPSKHQTAELRRLLTPRAKVITP